MNRVSQGRAFKEDQLLSVAAARAENSHSTMVTYVAAHPDARNVPFGHDAAIRTRFHLKGTAANR